MPSVTVSSNAVTSNTINANRWFAQNGLRNDTPLSSMADITISFDSPSIPSDATILGLELSIHGQGNGGNTPGIALNNGSSTSSNLTCNSTWSKSDTTRTYGGSSNLWGLSWTPTTAANTTAIVDMSTIGTSRFFFDFVALIVHYQEAGGDPIKITSGLVKLLDGKIII
tara:strand:- start:976 stop:1482 length:507 start_codon:yes stop_codon:yes gene_type:complete